MKRVWLWVFGGWWAGFGGFWMPALAVLAVGTAATRGGRRLSVLFAGLSGLSAGMAGAALERPPFSGGSIMEVSGHAQEGTRRIHRLKGGESRASRELAGTWAPGSPVWVPANPRLPSLPLSGARRLARPPEMEEEPDGSLVDALTLGKPPPRKLRTQLRHAGLSHVLALSGLHLSIVTGMVLWLAGFVHRLLPPAWGIERRLPETVAGIAFAWVYHAATGAHVSTTRSALMLTMWLLSSRFWGVGGLFTSLLLAAAAMWAWDPASFVDPGFQLSFSAVAGMGLAMRWAPGSRGLWRAVLVSAGATATTLPLVWWHFGRISPLFLANNLLFLPLFSIIIIPISFITKAFVIVFPYIGNPMQNFLDGLSPLLSALLGRWNDAWPEWTVAGTAAWTLVLCAAIARGAKRPRAGMPLVLAAFAALAFLPFGRVDVAGLRLTFFAAGGESVLLRFPRGENWLVDAGTPGLARQLALRGVTRLHGVVLTHNHDDHVREIFHLAKTMDVDAVWVGTRFPEAWKRRLVAAGARVRIMAPSMDVAGGRLVLRSLQDGSGPAAPSFWAENDTSLVLELEWGGRSLWFMGDVEQAAERELTRGCIPRAVDLMKVPHHGRATSTGPKLLACLPPRTALVCGGPADPGVLFRLARAGARIVRVQVAEEITIEPCSLFSCGWKKGKSK